MLAFLVIKKYNEALQGVYFSLRIKYLLLAEFSVRTVNYGPGFFPLIYGLRASRLGHKSMEKNEDP